MKHVFFTFNFMFWATVLAAQQDSLPVPKPKPMLLEQKINATRQELRHSFVMEDPAGAGLWLDSLTRLEDDTYIGANWDERWLLYFWVENYGALLAEASLFGAEERAQQSWKVPPPADSLFEIIDSTLFDKRYDLFQNIRHAFLNEEEKVFATLLLEYLLRLNTEEEDWAARIEAFEAQYPTSRFNRFLGSVKPAILKPANKALGMSVHFLSGSWSGELERSLNPLYGAQIDLYYWVDRWNLSASAIFGGPKLARDVSDGFDIWPKDDPTSFAGFGLEVGYDVLNTSKVRMFPGVGGGLAVLKPTLTSEDSEDIPEYYDNFNYLEWHLSASLTADAKLFGKDHKSWAVPKGSYHGIRMRVGYHWLGFKGQNRLLGGNLFYFAIGYNLFAYKEARK
jgi:hypothetical protein